MDRVLFRMKQVDVFTDKPLEGNPLAVVFSADRLNEATMQRIAREMNLSETTFILRPRDPRADYRMRIFTPSREIPFAGHPSIGTAHALIEEQCIKLQGVGTTVYQEIAIGILPLEIYTDAGKVERIMMTQGRPSFGQQVEETNWLADALGITAEKINSTGLKPQVVSTGLDQLFIPIENLRTVRELKPNLTKIGEIESKLNVVGCFAFTLEAENKGNFVHGRMFAPNEGVTEDPATGSAAGALGAYLMNHGKLPIDDPAKFSIEQGHEISRPSRIFVEVYHDRGVPTKIRVGGKAVTVLNGALELTETS